MSKVDISEFVRIIEAINKAGKALPAELASIAVNFSKERFRERAWFDRSKEPWERRKLRRKGGKKRSQHLLVDTGRLKRSIRKIYADQNLIIIGTDVPYAEIHNNGGEIEKTVTVKQHIRKEHSRKRKGRKKELVKSHVVKTHKRTMKLKVPARPFIGESYALQQNLIKHISEKIINTLTK